jgi:hypothetical protein
VALKALASLFKNDIWVNLAPNKEAGEGKFLIKGE